MVIRQRSVSVLFFLSTTPLLPNNRWIESHPSHDLQIPLLTKTVGVITVSLSVSKKTPFRPFVLGDTSSLSLSLSPPPPQPLPLPQPPVEGNRSARSSVNLDVADLLLQGLELLLQVLVLLGHLLVLRLPLVPLVLQRLYLALKVAGFYVSLSKSAKQCDAWLVRCKYSLYI